MDRKQVELLKQLANERVTDIFDAFGLEYIDRYEYYTMPCPIHGGDNVTGFSWHKDRCRWKCWTHHCDEEGNDIIDFIVKYRKCSFVQAVEQLKTICAGEFNLDKEDSQLEQEMEFNRYLKEQTKAKRKEHRVYNPTILDALQDHPYLRDRGFDQKVLDRYQAGLVDKPGSIMHNRILIPVVTLRGALVGFTGRTVVPDDYRPKWRHSEGLPKEEVLFNLNFAADHIRKSHQVIIVEGPLDVFKFEMAGVHNSVAVLGSSLTNSQRSLLLQLEGCYDIIIAFDDDAAGIQGMNKIVAQCGSYFNIFKYELPEGRDVGDLSIEEICALEKREVKND